jgi:hypothetical protein
VKCVQEIRVVRVRVSDAATEDQRDEDCQHRFAHLTLFWGPLAASMYGIVSGHMSFAAAT